MTYSGTFAAGDQILLQVESTDVTKAVLAHNGLKVDAIIREPGQEFPRALSYTFATSGDGALFVDVNGSARIDGTCIPAPDVTPPTVAIGVPGSGAVYDLNQVVLADFKCGDSQDPHPSCTGTVPSGSPIDTSSGGHKVFTVIAIDEAGNRTTATAYYTVTDLASTACDFVDGSVWSGTTQILLSYGGTFAGGDQVSFAVESPNATWASLTFKKTQVDMITRPDMKPPLPPWPRDLTYTFPTADNGPLVLQLNGSAVVYGTCVRAPDTVPPSIQIKVPPDGVNFPGHGVYAVNQEVLAMFVCTDDRTPYPTCEGTVPVGSAIDTSSGGEKTFTVVATDEAGNQATLSTTYTVVYGFTGFAPPVDANVVNVANAGQAIPLKFRVTDVNGAPYTDLTWISVTATSLACDALDETPDRIEEYAAGGSGLLNLGDGYYQFNWKTPKSHERSCKTLTVELGDEVAHEAVFRFTR